MVDTADISLRGVVGRALPGADDDTISIVAACAGLLAGVAYADRQFSDDEADKIGVLMSTVEGIGPDGSRGIVQALKAHVVELASVHAMRFARTLKELGHRDLRLYLLTMLVDLAAADEQITHAEVNTLRQVTGALGLTQDDYNRAQSAHRDKLGTLD